jgi:hypothetical protein
VGDEPGEVAARLCTGTYSPFELSDVDDVDDTELLVVCSWELARREGIGMGIERDMSTTTTA